MSCSNSTFLYLVFLSILTLCIFCIFLRSSGFWNWTSSKGWQKVSRKQDAISRFTGRFGQSSWFLSGFVEVCVSFLLFRGCCCCCCCRCWLCLVLLSRACLIHSYFRHPRPRHHRDVYLLKTGILLFMHYHHDRFGAHTSSVAPWVKLSRMTSSPTPPTHEIAKGSSMLLDDITAMSPCAKIEFETILKILSL